jgi:hypothetical protein
LWFFVTRASITRVLKVACEGRSGLPEMRPQLVMQNGIPQRDEITPVSLGDSTSGPDRIFEKINRTSQRLIKSLDKR